jgi:outer membrane immunogenic protein
MKRLLLASVGLVALGIAVPASAADLPRKGPAVAPVAVAPIFNWTGFYIGGHIGWAHTDKEINHNFDPLFFDVHRRDHEMDGFLGGGQIGFNWQTGALVFGVEGQFSWVDFDNDDRCFTHRDRVIGGVVVVGAGDVHCGHKADWLATAAVRLGFAANNWLFYVKGGAAFIDESFRFHAPGFSGAFVVNGNGDDTEVGWMVGVGFEYGFTPNWSAKIEYNFMDFGDRDFHFRDTVFLNDHRINIEQQVHVVKFGINYRFGGKAPVAPVTARY